MAGGQRCVVEFLEPEPGPVGPGAAATRRRAGAVLAAGALLVTAVAVAIGARPEDAPQRRAEPSTRATSSLLADLPGPPPLLRPIPALALLPTPRCPTAGCSVLDWVADATLAAVRSAFPRAQVVSQMSAFGPSSMGAGDPLLARELRARAGRSTVVVDVVLTGSADADLVSRAPVALRVTGADVHAEVRLPAYRIAVEVHDGDRSTAARIRRMLADPGLMAVR